MGFLVEVDSLRVTYPNDFFKTWPLFATPASRFSHFYLKHMTAATTLVPEWQKLNDQCNKTPKQAVVVQRAGSSAVGDSSFSFGKYNLL